MDWLTTTYQPTTLFSLKPSWATSTGGKSLLVPTPYAFKMALLDVAIRTSGLATAQTAWTWLRELEVAIRLPPQIVVTNLFGRVLRQARSYKERQWPFQHTIGFREYVYFRDPLAIAVGYTHKQTDPDLLTFWLLQISYLGKRGGFMQLLSAPHQLPAAEHHAYVSLTKEPQAFDPRGLIQAVDDCDHKMKFEQADIYSSKRPKRLTRHVVIPYRIAHSSKSYTLYERLPAS